MKRETDLEQHRRQAKEEQMQQQRINAAGGNVAQDGFSISIGDDDEVDEDLVDTIGSFFRTRRAPAARERGDEHGRSKNECAGLAR